MLLLNDHFNDQRVVALTTDSSRDYTLKESSFFLTQHERFLLGQDLSINIKRFACARQVHGDQVLLVDEDFFLINQLQEADALITDLSDVVIAVRTADCLPIFLWDPVGSSMGVVHAGWKGTCKNIIRQTIEAMVRHFHTNAVNLRVAFGPAIRSCCYQVGHEFKDHFPDALIERNDKMYMDLIKANTDQLFSFGVNQDRIGDSGICTVCDTGYFSYRRDGVNAGRMISAMILRGE